MQDYTRNLFSCLIFFLLMMLPGTANSQNNSQNNFLTDTHQIDIQGDPTDKERKKKSPEDYIYLDMENLIHIYWALGKLSVHNSRTIDEYLQLTECDIFRRFFNNDIEWYKIREAAKGKLSKIQKDFPKGVRFVVPIRVGRYNLDKEHFQISSDTAFVDTRQLPVLALTNDGGKICGKSIRRLQNYPSRLVLGLDIPLDMQYIHMSPDQAEKLITQQSFIASKRTLYLQFFATLRKFQGQDRLYSEWFSYISANIDRVELYEDKGLSRKIHDVRRIVPQTGGVRESFR